MYITLSDETLMNKELPGYCNEGIPVPRVLCHSLTEVSEFPGKGMRILQNFQKFRVRVRCLTELPEFPGIVAQAYRTRRSSERVQNMMYPYSGYCCRGRTELPEVPGTGMNVVQNFQKFRVRV